MGYSSGRNNSSLKTPSAGASAGGGKESPLVEVVTDVLWNGLPSGPWMVTSKYLRLSSCGAAEIPGRGSAIRRSVSCRVEGGGRLSTPGRGVLVLESHTLIIRCDHGGVKHGDVSTDGSKTHLRKRHSTSLKMTNRG